MVDINQTVSHYKILKRLGGGGMGIVYQARDLTLKRQVALKFLPAHLNNDPQAKRRFLIEAQAASALDHPNVCTVHEIGETEAGELFICMAYCDGDTLRTRLADGPLPTEQAVEIALQVADALAAAHRRDIVHRDIKPGNLILTGDGRIKIVDFGLAKLRVELDLARGTTVGSPAYMSPEQATGSDLDRRTDLWSLGVVLYEMLTGRRPFASDPEHGVLHAILHHHPEPPSHLLGELPTWLDPILARCLAKERDARYPSADELARDLRRGLEAGTATRTAVQAAIADAGAAITTAGTAAGDPTPSVAVLPFSDLSPGRDQEWFCDGLAEEVTAALAGLQGIRVAARTSAFQFKGRAEDIRTIGRRLGVRSLLEGSVRKAGDRFRVTVKLLAAADGYTLWSERYDRELEDIFATQDEIAASIAQALEVRLVDRDRATTGAARRHSRDLEAYSEYLKGRHHWGRRTVEGLESGLVHFERARARDPDYALAYVGIADSYLMLGGPYGARAPAEAMPRAREAAERALALDESLAAAQCALASIRLLYDWDWSGGEAAFERALELDPGYPTAHQWYAMHLLVPQGRFTEAEAALERARELDPLSPAIRVSVAVAAYYRGDYERAIAACDATLELDPAFAVARAFRGLALAQLGRFDEASAQLGLALELAGSSHEIVAWAAQIEARAGNEERARELRDGLLAAEERSYVSPVRIAEVELTLGDPEAALEWLEKARQARDGVLTTVAVNPVLGPLREDRRFRALVTEVGLG